MYRGNIQRDGCKRSVVPLILISDGNQKTVMASHACSACKCYQIHIIVLRCVTFLSFLMGRERERERVAQFTLIVVVIGSYPDPAEAKLTPVISSPALREGSRYGGTSSFIPT